MKSLLIALALFSSPTFAAAPADDVLEQLRSLEGVTVKESTLPEDQAQNLRRFDLTIAQPEDHFVEDSPTFPQKLILFHRSFSEPMVLQTSGYSIYAGRLGRLAATFATNQIQVEHRFFAGSTPASHDWSLLTIKQSAFDFHHIVETFRLLYEKSWIGTGASKGGMTSIYHRHFFPDDMDGTVADVAPYSSGLSDPRYVDFLETVGGEKYADCRANLEALQVRLAQRMDELLPFIKGSYQSLGGKDIALEHAIEEMPFIFWQYQNPEDDKIGCAKIPGPQASPTELFAYLDKVNKLEGYNDEGVAGFLPYYVQSAMELGYPAAKTEHLRRYMKYDFDLSFYLPKGQEFAFSPDTQREVNDWMEEDASELLLVYGEFDPWTAGSYRTLNSEGDNHRFVAPQKNHRSNFTLLSDAQKAEAIQTISRWMGKEVPQPTFIPFLSSENQELYLEDLEAAHFR